MRTVDFRGFRFGKIHTSDLNLEVVSTSNRYEPRMLPAPTDQTVDIPGSDGQYYFGSIYKNREITCNVAFDNVSEQIYRKIRQLFSTDKLQDLVFDEEPYKTWKAKLKSKPEFKSLCFTDKETGQRVYKGDGKLNFICYYPYAFGFDKYIIRAADYYMLNPPECIINESYSDETFVKNNKNKNYGRILPEDIKYNYNMNPSDYEGGDTDNNNIENSFYRDKSHRNKENRSWNPNDNTIWKTGFPTPEQVEAGELFFDTDQGEKSIIDVRGYWDNVPEWQSAAKLLTTPTLDFEQELMYLPQYSKTDFVNMELGFDSSRSMIGTRMLVYNPGDLPVDWEIRFDENKRSFWSCRGGTKFRIRRFNVERLPIPHAVDWCGLTTYEISDNELFKYGNKYFKRRNSLKDELIFALENMNDEDFSALPSIYKSQEDYNNDNSSPTYSKMEIIAKLKQSIMVCDKNWGEELNYNYYNKTDLSVVSNNTNSHKSVSINTHLDDFWNKLLDNWNLVKDLNSAHPHYCYYVEPIPRQKLGHYIKLFYWQTIQWRGEQRVDETWIATDRYRELAKDIINENEKISDINNPLVKFLKYFANIKTDGTIETLNDNTYREIYKQLDFERGIELANRYEELFESCITEEEEFELYWETLKSLLHEFSPIISQSYLEVNKKELTKEKLDKEIDKFIDSYINHPSEFITTDMRDLDYDNVIFNGYKMPEWITEDYIEIDQSTLSGVDIIKQFLAAVGEDKDWIFSGNLRQYTEDDRNKLKEKRTYSKLIRTLDETIGINGYLNDLLDDYYYLNSDTRMLYTTVNPYGMEFVYKPTKILMNEAIHKGKWFKLPPGWSLICIEPVVDESLWGGKRWEDARPYDYGYGGDLNRNKREVQQLYDFVYDLAREEFFKIYPQDNINRKIIPETNLQNYENLDDSTNGTEDPKDELLKFKVWYEREIEYFVNSRNYFGLSYYQKLKQDGEYTFLKIIHSIWSALSPYFSWTSLKGVYIDPDTNQPPQLNDYDVTGLPLRCINGDISDWWWYACNYFWANFPPLYWAVADMLNRIKIKYTPLFY